MSQMTFSPCVLWLLPGSGVHRLVVLTSPGACQKCKFMSSFSGDHVQESTSTDFSDNFYPVQSLRPLF